LIQTGDGNRFAFRDGPGLTASATNAVVAKAESLLAARVNAWIGLISDPSLDGGG